MGLYRLAPTQNLYWNVYLKLIFKSHLVSEKGSYIYRVSCKSSSLNALFTSMKTKRFLSAEIKRSNSKRKKRQLEILDWSIDKA